MPCRPLLKPSVEAEVRQYVIVVDHFHILHGEPPLVLRACRVLVGHNLSIFRLPRLDIDQIGEILLDIIALAILDRKSTRLNSSHVATSYAVFCLKKKNIKYYT